MMVRLGQTLASELFRRGVTLPADDVVSIVGVLATQMVRDPDLGVSDALAQSSRVLASLQAAQASLLVMAESGPEPVIASALRALTDLHSTPERALPTPPIPAALTSQYASVMELLLADRRAVALSVLTILASRGS